MRKFGTEAAQYFDFQIEGSDKVYHIPLAVYMPASILLMMQDSDKRGDGFAGQMTMLRKYMGDDADELSAGMATQILTEWAEASQEAGVSAGES